MEFTKYDSKPKHLCILGKEGRVLVYRVRYDPSYVSQLSSSISRLYPVHANQTRRGEFEESHCAVWADYSLRSVPFVSLEFRKDNKRREAATKWIEANKDLLSALNNADRCIVPGKYSRVVFAEKRLGRKLGIGPLFRTWFGAAIHDKMSGRFASSL